MKELPETPLSEAERRPIEQSVDQRNPEIPPEPALVIQIVPEDPEELAVRECHHVINESMDNNKCTRSYNIQLSVFK